MMKERRLDIGIPLLDIGCSELYVKACPNFE